MTFANVEIEEVLSCAAHVFPWDGARRVRGTNMIEIDVFFFEWLGVAVAPLSTLDPNAPIASYAQALLIARIALEGFKDGSDMQRAFPRTAASANEVLGALNQIVPPVGSPWPKLSSAAPYETQRLRALAGSFQTTLRDEAQREYVLKLEDQRCLSVHALAEKIESCFSEASWKVIQNDAKREFEEAGKCLSVERYTGSGFHSLRGVECVIRQYIVDLTETLPKKRDWGFYVTILRENNADPGLVAVIDNIRSLERNPLIHPEDWLDVDEAIGMFTLSQTAISRLAAEMRKRFPGKYP